MFGGARPEELGIEPHPVMLIDCMRGCRANRVLYFAADSRDRIGRAAIAG